VRQLDWEGGVNVRDLGGLRTRDGGETARGAVVRSGSPDGLSERGWEALRAYGIRTIVDLRNDDERDAEPRAGVETLHLPLDRVEDEGFWSQWASGPEFGTGLYYRPHLDRFPERNARVIEAIARAEPGGVLFHCVGGRDRTGQITLLLLSLAGVEPEEIAADYCLSAGEGDGFLTARGTSSTEVILSVLAELDVEAYLREAGVSEADLESVRARLHEATGASPGRGQRQR
jgi:protein-tyrosine phosphatase